MSAESAIQQTQPSLSELPDDMVLSCLSFLNVPSLLSVSLVNRKYNLLARHNQAGWELHCHRLWRDKVFVCPKARQQLSVNAMGAYRSSLLDATERHHVLMDECCFDVTTKQGTVWSFRFKESAGPDWTSWDPWWNGEMARQLVFLKDGTVRQYKPVVGKEGNNEVDTYHGDDDDNDEDDVDMLDESREATANGSSSSSSTSSTSTSSTSSSSSPSPSSVGHTNATSFILEDPPVDMAWRFSARPMDFPERPNGSYLRFTVGGREVPTYVVRRSPTGNWGFIAESCWGVYSSFPMPLRVTATNNNNNNNNNDNIRQPDYQRPVHDGLETRPAVRTATGASALEAADATATNTATTKPELSPLNDDSSFTITNDVQWREALLYNFGARALPEGEFATQDFDRHLGRTEPLE